MAEVKRDRCSVCLAEFAINKNGTLRWHLGDKYVGRWRQLCDGAGKPPAVMHDPLGPDGWARGLIERAETDRG